MTIRVLGQFLLFINKLEFLLMRDTYSLVLQLSARPGPKFFYSFGQPSFWGMVCPIEQALTCLSLQEVSVCAGHKILMAFDDNIWLIVGDLQGILGQHLMPRQLHLLNSITVSINYIKSYINKLNLKTEDHQIQRQNLLPKCGQFGRHLLLA